jgi:hypothetical protein
MCDFGENHKMLWLVVVERVVPHTGFEPVISALRGRCPRPLDECGPRPGGPGRPEYTRRLRPPQTAAAASDEVLARQFVRYDRWSY